MRINQTKIEVGDLQESIPYRVFVDSIISNYDREIIYKKDDVFLGVSLNNNSFAYHKFLSMIDWISKNFSKCTILIADSIHRLTISSNNNLIGEKQALEMALLLGQEKINEIQPIIDHYRDKCELRFLLCSEIQKHSDYATFYNQIRNLYKNNANFRSLLQKIAEQYLRRKGNDLTKEQQAEIIKKSCAYFVEEFALFPYLQRIGISTLLYPGVFPAIDQLIKGNYLEAPLELQYCSVLSLKLRRKPWFNPKHN